MIIVIAMPSEERRSPSLPCSPPITSSLALLLLCVMRAVMSGGPALINIPQASHLEHVRSASESIITALAKFAPLCRRVAVRVQR